MTTMPVLAHLLSGGDIGRLDMRAGRPMRFGPMPDPRRKLLEEFVAFDVQTGADLYWTGSQDYFLWRDDYVGIFRLPFPMVWMEWKTPPVVKMHGKMTPRPGEDTRWAHSHAAGLAEVDIDAALRAFPILRNKIRPECVRLVIATLHTMINSDEPYVLEWPLTKIFQVDDTDTVVIAQDVWIEDEGDPADAQRWKESLSDLNVTAHALALINCRNVETRDAGRVLVHRTTAQKRRRELGDVRYKTIVLPGTKHHSKGSQTGSSREDMALHKVRGHFKTFTAEAPLLGKHVGTYWWGWSTRGAKDHGENVNDYLL